MCGKWKMDMINNMNFSGCFGSKEKRCKLVKMKWENNNSLEINGKRTLLSYQRPKQGLDLHAVEQERIYENNSV